MERKRKAARKPIQLDLLLVKTRQRNSPKLRIVSSTLFFHSAMTPKVVVNGKIKTR